MNEIIRILKETKQKINENPGNDQIFYDEARIKIVNQIVDNNIMLNSKVAVMLNSLTAENRDKLLSMCKSTFDSQVDGLIKKYVVEGPMNEDKFLSEIYVKTGEIVDTIDRFKNEIPFILSLIRIGEYFDFEKLKTGINDFYHEYVISKGGQLATDLIGFSKELSTEFLNKSSELYTSVSSAVVSALKSAGSALADFADRTVNTVGNYFNPQTPNTPAPPLPTTTLIKDSGLSDNEYTKYLTAALSFFALFGVAIGGYLIYNNINNTKKEIEETKNEIEKEPNPVKRNQIRKKLVYLTVKYRFMKFNAKRRKK